MNPESKQSPKSDLDARQDGGAANSSLDKSHNIPITDQPFDPSSYFDNFAFDDVYFLGLNSNEPCYSGPGYDTGSMEIFSQSPHPPSDTGLPPMTGQEFPFRTRTDRQSPQPIGAISIPTASPLNETLPSPNEVSTDIGFGLSIKTHSGAEIPIQSVRNSQLEKRRAQNRNSQRAFRERKESYTNYLERELLCLRKKYDTALRALYRLRAAYLAIESLDRFDVAFKERVMGTAAEELKEEVENVTYGSG